MAAIIGNEYDHVDFTKLGITTRHPLKDAAARQMVDDIVKIQDAKPNLDDNKIWIKETPESEVQIPTYDEFLELKTAAGNLSNLETTDKNNLVAAINEAYSEADRAKGIQTIIGDLSDLTTVNKTDIVSAINEVASSSGGGGTSDYNDLYNKPQIAGVALSGNKSLSDLGIPTITTDSTGIVISSLTNIGTRLFSTMVESEPLRGSNATDYDSLFNKPQINNVTLIGNKTLSDFGIASITTDTYGLIIAL